MKKIYIYSLSLLLSVFITFNGNAQVTSSWASLTSGTTNAILGISAPSPTVCYVAGDSGLIKKTINGGTSWVTQNSGTTSLLYFICFTDILHGYAVGNNGAAISTSDGGNVWTPINLGTTAPLRSVFFFDANTGYITGGFSNSPGIIYKTTDAGMTWTNLSTSGISTNTIYGIYFTSIDTGYANDFDKNIIKTTDGGNNWISYPGGGTNPLFGSIHFISPTNGIVTGQNGTIRMTANSGNTWSGVTGGPLTDSYYGLDFYNSSNGFIVGGSLPNNTGTILSTSDGGLTWSNYPTGTSRLYGIDMADANTGYAVGLNGTILKYSNALNLTVATTNATGSCNGNATANATGGNPPYNYLWSNGATSAYVDSLCLGTYTVFVIDSNGVSDTVSFTITSPPTTINVSISSINCSAFGACDGIAAATATGGYAPYTYSWNNGHTTSSISGLCAGTYIVIVGDSTGMTGINSVIITEPSDTAYIDSSLTLSTVISNVSVFGFCDGAATVTAAGGTPPYSYVWSTGATTVSISGLCSNVYFVSAIDSNGQNVSTGVYVSEPLNVFTNPVTTTPVDTIYSSPIDTCIVDYNFPIDSAFVASFTVIDANTVSVNWVIWQNGLSATITTLFEYTTSGSNLLVLTLNCSGNFRELQSSVISDAINIGGTVRTDNDLDIGSLLKIYPNPANNYFTIELPSLSTDSQLQIKNVLGQIIYHESINVSSIKKIKQITTDNYSKGIYFVQVISENRIIGNKKIVIE